MFFFLVFFTLLLNNHNGNITLDFLNGSPPSSIKSFKVVKFPYVAATCTGVCPSSVFMFGPAPDLSSIRAQRSPSFTRAAICNGVSSNLPPAIMTKKIKNYIDFVSKNLTVVKMCALSVHLNTKSCHLLFQQTHTSSPALRYKRN